MSPAPSDRPRVLYVAGAGRSGSTIVGQVLEASLDAVHVGEVRYLWDRGVDEDHLCECGRAFSACPFWTAVLDGACPDGVPAARRRIAELAPLVDRQRRLAADVAVARGWRRSAAVTAYGDVLGPVYEQVRDRSGAGLVVDSSKDPSYLFALRATGRIDLSVVHLVRDSRAVAYSWTRRRVRPEVRPGQGGEPELMKVHPPRHSARRWLEVNAMVEAYLRMWPGIRVRYEDFAEDPDAVVDRVVALTDVTRRPEPGQPEDRHSFSGNPIRFDRGPLSVRVDASWATELGDADRRAVTRLTAPLLRRYGYPLRKPRATTRGTT